MVLCKICSAVVLSVYPPCEFCKESFCMTHLQPEVHGCDMACRNDQRRKAEEAAIAQRKARQHVGNDAAHEALKKRIEAGEESRKKKTARKK